MATVTKKSIADGCVLAAALDTQVQQVIQQSMWIRHYKNSVKERADVHKLIMAAYDNLAQAVNNIQDARELLLRTP